MDVRPECHAVEDCSPPQVVVFDLDDTLILEADFASSGFHSVGMLFRERTGCNSLEAECLALWQRGLRTRIIDEALLHTGWPADPALRDELIACFRTHSPSLTVLPDALACIDALRRAPEVMALAVVSDGRLVTQRRKAEAIGIERLFDHVIFTDGWGREFWKPHPRAFLEVERLTGYAGRACVYVGDNPCKDFTAPSALRWRTVRVRRRGGLYAELSTPPGMVVDHEVEDLRGLPQILGLEKQADAVVPAARPAPR